MTCPVAIRGAEQWSRWSNMNHRTLLVSEGSEGRNRLPVGGSRFLPVLRYGFILLALCMLLSDTFRLAFSRSSSQDVTARIQPVHSTQPVHRVSHARLFAAKKHTGV
jgi:hypothetical protein